MGINNTSLTCEPKFRTPKIISSLMVCPQSICPGALGSKLNYSKLIINRLSEHVFLKKKTCNV